MDSSYDFDPIKIVWCIFIYFTFLVDFQTTSKTINNNIKFT